MSAAPDGYDADADSRRTFELYWAMKRAELREREVDVAVERLREALRKHGRPNEIVTHPEIDAAFAALLMTGPVRTCEVER